MNTEAIHADGTIIKDEAGADTIRFERRLPHPVDATWAAITDPERLVKWWGEAEVELSPGGAFKLRWLNTDEDGNAVALDGRIVELDPPSILEIAGDWYAESATGRTDESRASLRFELRADGDGTVLRFENKVDRGADERSQVIAGWHFHLDALAASLDGRSVDLTDPWAAWTPIHEAYVAASG